MNSFQIDGAFGSCLDCCGVYTYVKVEVPGVTLGEVSTARL